jgi:hypothetical protein
MPQTKEETYFTADEEEPPDFGDEEESAELGETLKPEKEQESAVENPPLATKLCGNCGHQNSTQELYCSSCRKSIAAQGTTAEQRDLRTENIFKSVLGEYGYYWRPLKSRGVQSKRGLDRKKARNKDDRARVWGAKVRSRLDHHC